MENKFTPFRKVLVRDHESDYWKANLYSHFNDEAPSHKHVCVSTSWVQCLPYEGNENLLGTTNSPEQKRWRAERGGRYYYVYNNCGVIESFEYNTLCDDVYYEIGNYYRTKQEAEAAAERVRKAYKGE